MVNLIAETWAQDAYGVSKPTETSRTVFCSVRSVSASEFFDGGRNGLNPDFQISMFAPDYNGERTIEFEGKRYGVYRTYKQRNDIIELYVERKGGVNAS